jgi:23S rRNA pseudouridine2605 synthase
MEKGKKRLSKTLAAAGVASRRACEELIFDGKVTVNGVVELKPQTLVGDSDKIAVNGQPIQGAERKVYYILNKPAGYICSNARLNRTTKLVTDLFPDSKERLFTVGRLDKDTEGLILVTNDGHFANQLIHPSRNITKEYLAKTDHDLTHEHLVAISSGALVQGTFVKPASVAKVRRGSVKISVHEGKKHEVRILLEAAGLKVLSLKRIRIGGLLLGTLPTGEWRELTEKEKKTVLNP